MVDNLIVIIMAFCIVSLFKGILIGRENNLKYWLYDSSNELAAAVWIVIGTAFLVNSFNDPENIWISLPIGLVLFGGCAYVLYTETKSQVYTKKDLWILLLGKITFGLIAFWIIILIALMFHSKFKK